VQRDFHSLISEIGKPGHSPKPRGNSLGRVTGHTQPKRSKHPVVKKQSKSTPNKQSALKTGGIQALGQLLNHPAATFVIAALEDWQKSRG
jgi:hypothetical protein